MALETPLYMQPASGDSAIQYSARQDRAGLLSSIFSREGVLDRDAGHLRVTQRSAGANMSVDVAAGRCAIVGDDISDQGTYVCSNTTPVNLTVPARPASGSRTHRVVARIRDKLSSGVWSTYDWSIELLPDTGSGTPALPNSAINLATVTVSSSASSVTNAMITDQRPRATSGTRARTGVVAPYAGWTAVAERQPVYSVNPDGVVLLSGQIMRSAATFNTVAGTPYEFGTIPTDIVPSGPRLMLALGQGYRTDMVLHIGTNGVLYLSFNSVQSVQQNVFWASLDSVTYRVEG